MLFERDSQRGNVARLVGRADAVTRDAGQLQQPLTVRDAQERGRDLGAVDPKQQVVATSVDAGDLEAHLLQ